MATSIPQILLSSSSTMPVIGMGTASHPRAEPEKTKEAIIEAIKVGYRHFDTASLYGTEEALGQAIAEALRLGLLQSRDDLFITSKLWCDSAERHLVVPAINNTLQNLGLKYLDLYLIHWPMKLNKEVFEIPIPKDCISLMDIKSVWEGMEECQNLGLTKAIGVNNFSAKRLLQMLSFAKIPPTVNQVEMNPLWQQQQLRDFCEAKGIRVVAYSPLSTVVTATVCGQNQQTACHVLQDIAKAKAKTLAQVSLRWVYEQGVSFVTKSFNKERMEENLRIFDCL